MKKLAWVVVICAAWIFCPHASSGADFTHQAAAMGGYHYYMKSNYLKRADDYYDTGKMNGGNVELDYRLHFSDRFGFIAGLYYNRAYEEYHKNQGELRVKFETLGFSWGPYFIFPNKSPIAPYFGVGIDLAQHAGTVEMDCAGDNITAGNEKEVGMGAHLRIGAIIPISPRWSLLIEDRQAYIPIINYAGSDETFDVGGNFLQCGVSYSFS